jgi:hypothetical protein
MVKNSPPDYKSLFLQEKERRKEAEASQKQAETSQKQAEASQKQAEVSQKQAEASQKQTEDREKQARDEERRDREHTRLQRLFASHPYLSSQPLKVETPLSLDHRDDSSSQGRRPSDVTETMDGLPSSKGRSL